MPAQDMANTAGKTAKVVLDNEKVRVIELNMAPGAKTGMHSHGDNLVVFSPAAKPSRRWPMGRQDHEQASRAKCCGAGR